MKTATGLTLVAIGAILAFAVHAHLRVLNLNVVGWVIILAGLAGIFMPHSGYGWLRRRVLVRRTPQGPVVSTVDETRLPPYLLNPEVPAADEVVARYEDAQPGTARQPETETIEEYFEE
jgi:hypothetical protein